MATKIKFDSGSFWIKTISIVSLMFLVHYVGYFYYKSYVVKKGLSGVVRIKDRIVGDIEHYFNEQIDIATRVLVQKKDIALAAQDIKDHVSCRYVLFVDPDGTVAYSSSHKMPVHTNIVSGQYKDSSLAKHLEQAPILFSPVISEFEFFLDEPTIFLILPYMIDQAYAGSFAIAIQNDSLEKMIAAYFPEVDDILVAKRQKENALVVFRTKNDDNAAFKMSFSLRSDALIARAIKGDSGFDVSEVNGKKYLNSRTYLVGTGWAIVVRHDFDKNLLWVHILKYVLWVWAILLIIALISSFLCLKDYVFAVLSTKHAAIVSFITIVLFIISSFIFSFIAKNYTLQQSKIYDQELVEIKLETEYVAAKILEVLYKIESLGHETIIDFKSGKLTRDTFEQYAIKQLHGEEIALGMVFDDTCFLRKNKEIKKGILLEKSCLMDAAKGVKEPTWKGPVALKEMDDQLVLLYIEPSKEGVVTVIFPYHMLIDALAYLEEGVQQKAIVFAADGNVIFYKDKSYVLDGMHFDEIVTTMSPELKMVEQKARLGYSGQLNFKNKKSKEAEWAIYTSIPVANWTLLILATDRDFYKVTKDLYQLVVWLIIAMILVVLCALVYLTKAYLLEERRLRIFSALYSVALVCAIGFLLFAYYKFSVEQEHPLAINNKFKLNKIVENEAGKNRAIPIKTGVEIDFMHINDFSNISFIARVWQVFDSNEHVGIERGVVVKNISQNFVAKEIGRKQENGKETIWWEISGSIYQLKNNYAKSPFDIQPIDIVFESKDMRNNVVLELDIDTYKKIEPWEAPGISKSIDTISNFVIESSFFYYKNTDGKVNQSSDLVFRVNLKRKTLSAFINFIIPLGAILFTIFMLYLYHLFSNGVNISIYVALFFSLILLQQNYRSTVHMTVTTFLDYVIFMLYLILAASYLDYFLTKKAQKARIIFYWPLFLLVLFLITAISFYSL